MLNVPFTPCISCHCYNTCQLFSNIVLDFVISVLARINASLQFVYLLHFQCVYICLIASLDMCFFLDLLPCIFNGTNLSVMP